MEHGPVEVMLVAFGEPHFDGSIMRELGRLVDGGTIEVLDAAIVARSETGERILFDIEDLPSADRRLLGFESGVDLFDAEDVETLFEGLAPGSAVVAIAMEHRWARRLRESIEHTGGEVAYDFRLSDAVADDVLAEHS